MMDDDDDDDPLPPLTSYRPPTIRPCMHATSTQSEVVLRLGQALVSDD